MNIQDTDKQGQEDKVQDPNNCDANPDPNWKKMDPDPIQQSRIN